MFWGGAMRKSMACLGRPTEEWTDVLGWSDAQEGTKGVEGLRG